MRERFDALVTMLLVAAAVTIAAVLTHREFAVSSEIRKSIPQHSFVSSWDTLLEHGRTLGRAEARIKIIEFADVECPFCKVFHEAVRELRAAYPEDVAHVYFHYPLPQHRFARPGATALECAAPSGKFSHMLDVLFRKQDSLGLKTWGEFAREAGVLDTASFRRCMADAVSLLQVEADYGLGRSLEVAVTPTVIVNGWRFGLPPNAQMLRSTVEEPLAGGTPSIAGSR